MNLRNRILLLAGLLLSLLLFGCGGAEDGDLTPPNFTFDGGVPAVTGDPGTIAVPYTFSGTSDPGTAIAVEVFPPAGGVAATTTPPVVQINGDWSFDVYNLAEGLNQISIEASDPIGNAFIHFVNIVLDLTGPVVSIDQYQTPALPVAHDIAGTVSEAGSTVTIDLLDASDASVLTPVSGVTTTLGNNTWRAAVDLTGLADGTYTLTATGFDRFGNASAVAATRTIDIDAANTPALAFTTPATFPEVIADPTNIASVSFVGTKQTGCDLSVTTTTGTITNPNLNDSFDFTADLLLSGNSVVSLTLNGIGCSGTSVARKLIVRDLAAPVVADIFPRSAATVPVNSTPTISIVFSETMDPLTVVADSTVILENVTDPANVSPVALAATGNDTVTFDFTPTIPLSSAGKYKVRVLNDSVTPVTITDARQNAFVGEASAIFIVQ